jgi:hypothetical protein
MDFLASGNGVKLSTNKVILEKSEVKNFQISRLIKTPFEFFFLLLREIHIFDNYVVQCHQCVLISSSYI